MPADATPPPVPAVPRATARIQFTGDMGFDTAAALVPYLARLGVSHLYASPFLKARPGSAHGYDITDHAQFNGEIGDEAAFDAMVAALKAHGMGLILDFVPNHMGIGGADNPWWLDVLEWGEGSPYAPFFDIDWRSGGRLLLPILGDQYGSVLERGELRLKLEGGAFSIWYWSHRCPVAVRDYPKLLRQAWDRLEDAGDKEALGEVANGFAALGTPTRSVQKQSMIRRQADELKARLDGLVRERRGIARAIAQVCDRLNGEAGVPKSFRELHELLERQAYRVAFWRVAADEINYRRFFDINELAGLRIERPELFELAHQLVFRLIGEGKLQGLRIDHIDGLFDPKAYCGQVQDRAAYLLDRAGLPAQPPGAPALGEPLYLVVEKILARHEHLRDDWPVAGTTGYEFMVLVNGLFVDPSAEEDLTHIYEQFLEREADFEAMLVTAKRLILSRNLSAELNVLARELHALAQQSWATRDHTVTGIRRALSDIVAHFPVYRTYITEDQVVEEDRRFIDWAVNRARKTAEAATDLSVYDFLREALSTTLAREKRPGYKAADVIRVAMKTQQFTGPVMAKAVEDTLFYRYVRLVSLNEVGGDPDRFGTTVSAFHYSNQERLRRWPHQLVTVATHDHKRGADTRVRIDVISELPDDWQRQVRKWARLNRMKKRELETRPAPGRNDEYLLYQTMLGAWPLGLRPDDLDGLAAFGERIQGYMLKAVRESKFRSNWAQPDTDYEDALQKFIQGILDPERSQHFLQDFVGFVDRVAPVGAVNGLSQALLTATVPGVPDIYQGTEGWDFTLVDPDNRRPPDWTALDQALRHPAEAEDLLRRWQDGRIKQHVWATALAHRRDNPGLYAQGEYVAMEASGAQADRVVGFLRRLDGKVAIIVAPRLVAPLMGEAPDRPMVPAEAWGNTILHVPELPPGMDCTNLLTGERVPSTNGEGRLPVGEVLRRFPVALLSCG